MSKNARARKTPPGVTAIRIPRQRRSRFGRGSVEPIILVVPEQPSLGVRAATAVGGWLWDRRGAWAPTGIALAAFAATAVGHLLAWWTGLVLAPAAALPLAWLLLVKRRRPAGDRTVRHLRIGLAALATTVTAWAALALAFGPTAGPLELLWALTAIAAQTLWLFARRNPETTEEIR